MPGPNTKPIAFSRQRAYKRSKNMVKTITKFIRLGLTPELSEKIRAEAKRRKISISALIRVAVKQHLSASSLLTTPIVEWTSAEKEYADRVLQEHFDEDRNEVIR
jgi:hypothetical protein